MVSNVWKSNPWPLKAAKVAYRCAGTGAKPGAASWRQEVKGL